MNKTTQSGFTLYELMITVAIVGVVLAIGVPNMRSYSQNSRMTATANDLHAMFHMARSEAPRAKSTITVCASTNAMTAAATCSGGNDWDKGFIAFIDTDGDLVRDTGGLDPETVLRSHPAIQEGVTLTVENNAAYFSFAPSGLGVTVGGNTPLTRVLMCDERGNIQVGAKSAARLLVVTPLGRATVVRDKAVIAGAITQMGASCP